MAEMIPDDTLDGFGLLKMIQLKNYTSLDHRCHLALIPWFIYYLQSGTHLPSFNGPFRGVASVMVVGAKDLQKEFNLLLFCKSVKI